jgi:hypothetical protein
LDAVDPVIAACGYHFWKTGILFCATTMIVARLYIVRHGETGKYLRFLWWIGLTLVLNAKMKTEHISSKANEIPC